MSEKKENSSTSKETKPGKELISDQYYAIERVAHILAVLRDGIREAPTDKELWAWQDIVDMALEHGVLELDKALREIAEEFDGLEYDSIVMSPYSLLRAYDCDCHKHKKMY